jgi:hypothetical protein
VDKGYSNKEVVGDVDVIEQEEGRWAVRLPLSRLARGDTIKELSISSRGTGRKQQRVFFTP